MIDLLASVDLTGLTPDATSQDMVSFYASIVALVIGVVSLISVIWMGATRLAKLEVKVDTMWAFQMRRAFTEAMDQGIATVNSPLTFTVDVRERMRPIEKELRQFWIDTGSHMKNDAEVLLGIEAQFGARLIEMVCIPCRLTHGACLLLAYAVATDRIQINLDSLTLEHGQKGLSADDAEPDFSAHIVIGQEC